MADIFASDSVFEQDVELREALGDWIKKRYPEAKTIEQVVLWRRQDEIIDDARYGFAEAERDTDQGAINA